MIVVASNRIPALVIVVIVLSLLGCGRNDKYGDDYDNADRAAEQSIGGEYNPSGCTSDCSGHYAGYEWAEENAITNPDDCEGNSQSFIEGCEDYANEQETENEDESLEPIGFGRYEE